MTGKELVAAGYYQVSRKYRLVARLPEGKTGKEMLLAEAKKERPWDAEKWVGHFSEQAATDHWLRVYSTYHPELEKELTPKQFSDFLKAGGSTAR